MDILVKIIQFFLCFTILIGIHEMGHFIMARVFKIRVEKFYIFFDPWFSLFKFKRGNTEYGLGWLPLGGYVKIAGMIDESMDTEQMKQPVKQDEFRAKPAWQRFLVMIAGVVMNVVLAVAIYIGICYTWGDTYFSNADAKWGYNFNEAGHKLGFHDGDRLVSIDGEEADDINKVVNSLIITESDRSVVVERNGRQVELILPLDELISMRQQKGYENFLLPRIPFLIDSVVNPTVAQLRKGDEIVAIDNVSGLDFAGYGQYLKAHAGDSVLLTVLREGDMLFEFKAPVSENGTLGVIRKGPRAAHAEIYVPGGDSGRYSKDGQGDLLLLGPAEDDRAAQNQDVRGAGRIHLHRQHLPLHVGLAGLLDEDRLPVDHPRGDEHSADPGTRRRARDLHFLGDDLGPQGERQGARSGAVCRTDHHSVPAALRQRQRHLPVLYQINAEPMTNRTAEKTEACAAALRRHRFEAEVVKDAEAAFALMKAVVEAENPQLVSFGDSMTMRGTGIVEWLRSNGRLTLLDGFDASKPYEERLEIRRRALLSDLFHHGRERRDGAGNTALAGQGGQPHRTGGIRSPKGDHRGGTQQDRGRPRRGRERIRRIAAPQNVARHPGFRTPCAKTGVCADCNSQDRICNTRMEMLRCWPDKRVLVILIDEDSGL